jgi:hypothetical protein
MPASRRRRRSVGERLAQGLVEVRVYEVHEWQPLEIGADGLGDLRELLVHLLTSVELELLVEEAWILQNLVQRREEELLVGKLER